MDAILQMGIEIIIWLQNLGEWLIGPMMAVTFLGNEEFYLFIAPAIYWCWDARLGLRLGLALMVSSIANTTVKLALHGPRPYWIDARVQAYSAETSFGVPSGHSMSAVVVWGRMAAWIKRGWAWAAAILLMLLIGLSRMYLGVHFPHDALLGWFLGAVVLWLIIKIEPPVIAYLKSKKPLEQITIIFGSSLLLILLAASARLALGDWSLPASWAEAAAKAVPDADPIAPLALSGVVSNAGVFFGLAAGAVIMNHQGGFDAGGAAWKRIVRFLIGLVGVLLIWEGLGMVFPRGETIFAYSLRYFRYGLVGIWISLLGPRLFIRIKLAEKLA